MSGHARRSESWRMGIAALIVAAGLLAAAWLATGEELWGLLVALIVQVAALVLAGVWLQPLGGRQVLLTALFFAVAMLAACALALDSAEDLRELVPLLGTSTGGLWVILASVATRARRQIC